VQQFLAKENSEGRPGGSPFALREGYSIGPGGSFIYRPPRGAGAIVGGLIAGVALLLSLLLVIKAIDEGPSVIGLLAVVVGLFLFSLFLLFGYWTVACITLEYIVDRDGLIIRWGMVRQIVPLREIRRLVVGAQIPLPRIRGVNWLGYHVGQAQTERIGTTLFYSTHQRPDEVLYVLTAGPAYGITVLEPTVFASAVQQQRALGPTSPYPIRPAHPWPVLQSFALDRRALALAAVTVLSFVLVAGALLVRYPSLPDDVTVHFPAAVERVVAKRELLQIPLTGAVILAINLVLAYLLHSWERALSYLILGASIGMSVLLLSAVILAVV
jgi:hypothetical protein